MQLPARALNGGFRQLFACCMDKYRYRIFHRNSGISKPVGIIYHSTFSQQNRSRIDITDYCSDDPAETKARHSAVLIAGEGNIINLGESIPAAGCINWERMKIYRAETGKAQA